MKSADFEGHKRRHAETFPRGSSTFMARSVRAFKARPALRAGEPVEVLATAFVDHGKGIYKSRVLVKTKLGAERWVDDGKVVVPARARLTGTPERHLAAVGY